MLLCRIIQGSGDASWQGISHHCLQILQSVALSALLRNGKIFQYSLLGFWKKWVGILFSSARCCLYTFQHCTHTQYCSQWKGQLRIRYSWFLVSWWQTLHAHIYLFIILVYTAVCLTMVCLALLAQRINETDPEEGNTETDRQSWGSHLEFLYCHTNIFIMPKPLD